jgi:hypothetical protein
MLEEDEILMKSDWFFFVHMCYRVIVCYTLLQAYILCLACPFPTELCFQLSIDVEIKKSLLSTTSKLICGLLFP